MLLSVLLLPAVAFSQPVTVEKPIICNHTNLVMAELARSEYREIPIWLGDSGNNTKVLLILNSKTKTWTLILFNNEVACPLAAGENYRLFEANM